MSSCARLPQLVLFLGCLSSCWTSSSVLAQITPDASLGRESSVVTPNISIKEALSDLIEGGAFRNNNLFHSFSDFNIPEGDSVYFASPQGIENILTRVTGNNISEIFGTLGVDGAANLFLLNPNGIVFGQNAALDVNGSFLATTGESYVFDGWEYSANNPKAPPLLRVNIPLGIQFGAKAEAIANRSLARDPIFNIPRGLQVPLGQTFTLLGGELSFPGGRLSAPQGKLELGSVAANSFVGINPTATSWNLDYSRVNEFRDINLNFAAAVDASGSGGGAIALQGRQISLRDGSIVAGNTLGGDAGGKLKITAAEKLELIGSDPSGQIHSSLTTSVLAGATGKGGDIEIIADSVLLEDGAAIASGTFGSGDSGDLSITARKIEVNGASANLSQSSVSTSVFSPTATGKGGNLTIDTEQLQLNDGGIIATGTLGVGASGDLTVNADDIVVSGTTSDTSTSGLYTATFSPIATGTGGNLTITTNKLQIVDGGSIASATFGEADAGNLTIAAKNIIVRGTAPGSREAPQLAALGIDTTASGIFSSVAAPDAAGTGGNLTIDSARLELTDGGIIGTGTIGKGNSGDLTIDAGEIFISGIGSSGEFTSGLLSSVAIPTASGTGGEIEINADLLRISAGGTILTGTRGSGDSGNLNISAKRVEVDGASQISPSGMYTSVLSSAEGRGGDITIDTEQLAVTNGGAIGTGTTGIGDSGDLTVTSSEIEISGISLDNAFPSSLFSSVGLTDAIAAITVDESSVAATGDGGNITIITDKFRLTKGAQINASTAALGDAGSILLQAETINLSGTSPLSDIFPSRITAVSFSDAAAGSISIEAEALNLNHGAEILVSSFGTGDGGNLHIAADRIFLDRSSSLNAEVNAGKQGNINLITNNIFLFDNSEITAQANGNATGGNIQIDNRDNVVLLESQIIADAIRGNGGNIDINTRGIFVSANSQITASSQFGIDGNVEVNNSESDRKLGTVQLPNEISTPEAVIVSSCLISETNTFTVTGTGGLPENPNSYLRGRTIWQDTRELTSNSFNKDTRSRVTSFSVGRQRDAEINTIVESQGWIVNDKGNIELVAAVPQITPKTFWQRSPKCGNLFNK